MQGTQLTPRLISHSYIDIHLIITGP